MLLASQVLMLIAYGVTVYVGVNMHMRPTEVDTKLKESACARWGKGDTGSRLCHMLPAIQVCWAHRALFKTCSFLGTALV